MGFLPSADHQVEHIQAGQDAIPFGDIAAEGIAAAFLAADQGIGLEHLGGHVLEAHTGLVNRDIVDLPELVEHHGGGERLDDRAAQAAHLEQVIGQQAIDAQLVDELPVLVAHAQAVSVAVGDQQHIRMVVQGGLQADVDVRRDGLGAFHLREDRVALVVDLDDFGFSARQQAREVACAVAPHAVHHDGQAGILDRLQVDQCPAECSL